MCAHTCAYVGVYINIHKYTCAHVSEVGSLHLQICAKVANSLPTAAHSEQVLNS